MFHYLELTKDDIGALPRDTIFISCISPIEVHGPHLPVGTDLFIARQVMKELVKACPDYTFVQLPELPLGGQPVPVAGSLSVKGIYIEKLIYGWGLKLKEMGFSNWVLCDNHGGFTHQLALNNASRRLYKKGFNLMIPFLDIMKHMNSPEQIRDLPVEAKGGCEDAHAGTNETSLLLYTSRDKVRKTYASLPRYSPEPTWQGKLLATLFNKEIGRTTDWMLDHEHPSYVGDPSMANEEAGQTMIDFHVSRSKTMLADSMEGNYKPMQVFPWYIRMILRILPEW